MNKDDDHIPEGKKAFYDQIRRTDNPYEFNSESYSQWDSDWYEGYEEKHGYRKEPKEPKVPKEPFWERNYLPIAWVTGLITFFACWIYAIASWGFLLGLGLGWIPSFFVAVIIGADFLSTRDPGINQLTTMVID